MDYNTFKSMDAGSIAVLIGVNLLITVIAYLLVPIALALLGKKYDAKKIKRINLINCIVVWLAFRIIEIAMENDMSTGAAVFLWSAVGYGILKKHCLAPKQPTPTPSSHSAAQSYTPRVQLSAEDEDPPTHEHGLTYGSDIKLEQAAETPKIPTPSPAAQQTPSYVPTTKSTTKYCSRCGHAIDPVTKKCSDCGK